MTEGKQSDSKGDRPLAFQVGRDELVIRRRYEIASIVNDLMIGVWFAAGSVLFFSSSLMTAGTWLFLLGSLQLLVRPLIRLSRNLYVTRVSGSARGVLMGHSHDF